MTGPGEEPDPEEPEPDPEPEPDSSPGRTIENEDTRVQLGNMLDPETDY